MKNLNKKIGVVALAGMVVCGVFVVGGGKAQAASVGPLAIGNIYNANAQKFVEDFCNKNGMKILISSANPKEIDKYVKVQFKEKENLMHRLLDMQPGGMFESSEEEAFSQYLLEKKADPHGKRVFRLKFGSREYIIQVR